MASYPGSGKRPSRAPHNKYVGGEFALAISDRSGLAFPYNEMKFEWTGMFVHDSEWEPKQANLSHTGGAPNQLEPIFPPTIPSQYNGLGIITTNLLTSSLGSVTIVIT